LIGTWLLPLLGIHIGSGMINAIIVATIGAVVLLLILGFFKGDSPATPILALATLRRLEKVAFSLSLTHSFVTLSQQHRIMTTAVETVRRVINLRLKVLVESLRRLHRKSPPNLWHFGFAVRGVIAARMWRAMAGKLSAAEARRMVMEKQLAAMQAHLAYTESHFEW
jgi:hypothetical protein